MSKQIGDVNVKGGEVTIGTLINRSKSTDQPDTGFVTCPTCRLWSGIKQAFCTCPTCRDRRIIRADGRRIDESVW